MRLPLKTEYACQVLAQLASTYAVGEVRQVEELAAAEGLSPNYLVQILTTLRGAGLVISRRGKYGGYLLARHPETITLAEIAAAMMESCRQIPLTELIPPYVPLEGTDWVF